MPGAYDPYETISALTAFKSGYQVAPISLLIHSIFILIPYLIVIIVPLIAYFYVQLSAIQMEVASPNLDENLSVLVSWLSYISHFGGVLFFVFTFVVRFRWTNYTEVQLANSNRADRPPYEYPIEREDNR